MCNRLQHCTKLLAAALCLFALPAAAQVKLPSLFSDHMVIQRGLPVHIWGTATAGETVHADFRGHAADAHTDKVGAWSISLPAGDAGGPFTLTVRGANTLTFSDVLVGDIWLAGGQSNMEMPVGINPPWKMGVTNYKEELAAANYPSIRLFHVQFQHADYPQTDTVATPWTAVTPESVNGFSAVAYFFGREVYQHEHIPIGLIESDIGGSPAEAWMSMDSLTADPALFGVFQNWAAVTDKEYLRRRKEIVTADTDRAKGVDAAIIAGEQHRDTIFNGPAQLWNAMIAPLTPFPIKGILFYHGVANANPEDRALAYKHLFETLILDWRKRWNEGDIPFLYVQLQNHEAHEDLPRIREAQLQTLELPNTGMAVAVDIGDPKLYHPLDKQDVGHRLALWALATTYHQNVGEYSGPLFASAERQGQSIVVHFTHTTGGLVAKGGVLKGFEVAGADGDFVPAQASIAGDTVVATSAKIASPQFVRYAWASNPPCPLFNGAGLPAATFTSGK
jgi:sialate O-acetylesterase